MCSIMGTWGSFPHAPAFAKLLPDPAPAWIRLLRNTAAQIHDDFYP